MTRGWGAPEYGADGPGPVLGAGGGRGIREPGSYSVFENVVFDSSPRDLRAAK